MRSDLPLTDQEAEARVTIPDRITVAAQTLREEGWPVTAQNVSFLSDLPLATVEAHEKAMSRFAHIRLQAKIKAQAYQAA